MPPAIPAPALITDSPTFVAVSRARPCEPAPEDENSPLSEPDAPLLAARAPPLRAERDAALRAPLDALRVVPPLREPEPPLREPEPPLREPEPPLREPELPLAPRALELRFAAAAVLLRPLDDDDDDELFLAVELPLDAFAREPLPDVARDRVDPPELAERAGALRRVEEAPGSEPLPLDLLACESAELSAPLDEDRWPDVRRPDFR